MVLRHASRWLELISPKYSNWRCAMRPSLKRRLSTTLQYSWILPSFMRRLQRRNMREFYERNTTSTRTKVSTTSIAANQLQLLQALASRTVPKSLEINGELRKTG